MAQYYYLASSLPELSADSGITAHPFEVFRGFAAEELSPADRAEMEKCFLLKDLTALDALIRSPENRDIIPGALPGSSGRTDSELQRLLDDPDTAPEFIGESVARYRAGEQPLKGTTLLDGLCWGLMDSIHEDGNREPRGFAEEFITFEMRLRNLVLALNRRFAGTDLADDIIPFDDFSRRIAASGAPDFGLGGELGAMAALVDDFSSDNPMDNEKLISAIRWEWLDEKVDYHFFSAEAVFAFAIKLADIERWIILSPEEGSKRLDELLSRLHEEIMDKTSLFQNSGFGPDARPSRARKRRAVELHEHASAETTPQTVQRRILKETRTNEENL